MSFRVGMKVVCIRNESEWRQAPGITYPIKGVCYVVRAVYVDPGGVMGLRFHWLVNPIRDYNDGRSENTFAAFDRDGSMNFRPVVERKTDISIFTRMLKPQHEPVCVDKYDHAMRAVYLTMIEPSSGAEQVRTRPPASSRAGGDTRNLYLLRTL